MSNKYDALAALLERFSWLADSLVHSAQFEGNLRYEMQVTLLLRAMDCNDGFANKTLFEQAGVALPDKDATWDDWAKASKQVAESQQIPFPMALDRSGQRLNSDFSAH